MNELIPFAFSFNGKLITKQDPSIIGNNFRSLKNLRYMDTYLEGVGGMTPINSTILSNPQMRNAIHFLKNQPSETHVLVHAFDTSLQNGKIYNHTTAIPSSGGFGSSALFTCSDTTTERKGIFSYAPGGVVFCDGKDNLIWSGNEMDISNFTNYDPDGTFSKDYTNLVQNTLTDTDNIATLTRIPAGPDSNTKLLLHFNNNVNDSSTVGHVPANAALTFSSTEKVFGTHSAKGNGSTTSYMSIPDHACFDFSAGVFTIDFRFRATSLTKKQIIYNHRRGASSTYSFNIRCSTGGSLSLKIKDNGSTILNFETATLIISPDTWYHVAIVQNSSDFFTFVNGQQVAWKGSTVRTSDYTSAVVVGAGLSTGFLNGYLDEFRVSNTARWVSNFEPPAFAYGERTETYIYLGARRPLKGFKVYMGSVANSSSANMTAYEWNGIGWANISSLTDNTSCGGRSLAKTGTVTFTSTDTTSKLRSINGLVLYWYKILVEGADANLTVYHVTNNAPMQQIKDIWDGINRIIASCFKYTTTYQDYTTQVSEDTYDSSSSATFVNISSLTSSQFVLCGFLERMMGLIIHIAPDFENTTANTVLTVKYSSDGNTWTNVNGLVDGTSVDGISLAKTGIITWSPPSEVNEFIRGITTDAQFYYYKLIWSQTLDATVRIYYIAGVSAQKTIKGYKIPMVAKGRLWLLNNENNRKNSAICSALGLTEIWNGNDSAEYIFGDETELTGGISLYSVLGSNIHEIALFFKRNALWGISGNTPEDFVKYEITITDGLVAPKTLKKGTSLIGESIKPVVIWQGSKGIYMFDNQSVIPIHNDIKNFFDPLESDTTRKLHASYIENSSAFVDEKNFEYHWLFADASSTGSLNREYVLDLKSGKWYEINRGSGKYLQAGFTVTDTHSNTYNYGLTNTGYMERLEYGSHFDGNAIAHELWTGDMALEEKGSVMMETSLRKLKLISKSTTGTSNNIVVKHYVDGATNASSSFTLSPMRTGYRTTNVKHSLKGNPSGIFHSIRINMNTTNLTIGFIPIYIGGHYEKVREDL